jgi:hypothetical protein
VWAVHITLCMRLVAWDGRGQLDPIKPRRQRNAESLARVVLCTLVVGGVAWLLGGWPWGLSLALVALAVTAKLRADARAAWRRQSAARSALKRGDRFVLAQSVDLRADTDPGSAPLAALPSGCPVTLLGVRDDWLFVQADDGTEGWTRL